MSHPEPPAFFRTATLIRTTKGQEEFCGNRARTWPLANRAEEALMRSTTEQDLLELCALAEAIARSPIFVPARIAPASLLPASFEAVDVAVLDWIAAEGRAARSALRMH